MNTCQFHPKAMFYENMAECINSTGDSFWILFLHKSRRIRYTLHCSPECTTLCVINYNTSSYREKYNVTHHMRLRRHACHWLAQLWLALMAILSIINGRRARHRRFSSLIICAKSTSWLNGITGEQWRWSVEEFQPFQFWVDAIRCWTHVFVVPVGVPRYITNFHKHGESAINH